MKPMEVAEAFVDAINSRKPERLGALMTEGHTFINADGSEHSGREEMTAGWKGYYDMVPDFKIELSDRFERGNTVVFLGRASGAFVQNGELKDENSWSVPAAWRVLIEGDKVAVWQLFANQHDMWVIYERIQGK